MNWISTLFPCPMLDNKTWNSSFLCLRAISVLAVTRWKSSVCSQIHTMHIHWFSGTFHPRMIGLFCCLTEQAPPLFYLPICAVLPFRIVIQFILFIQGWSLQHCVQHVLLFTIVQLNFCISTRDNHTFDYAWSLVYNKSHQTCNKVSLYTIICYIQHSLPRGTRPTQMLAGLHLNVTATFLWV